jgi:hypothetical protein
MQTNYRKLTGPELEALRCSLNSNSGKTNKHEAEYRQFVRANYPGNAALVQFHINSEYNDNTYDNTVQYVEVRDANGSIVNPIDTAAAVKAMRNLSCPIEYETQEQVDEPVVICASNMKVPDIYVKE